MISTHSRERNIPRNEKRFSKTKLLKEKHKEWWVQCNENKTEEQRDFMGEREFEEKFLKLQLNDYYERVQSFITRGWSKGVSMSKLAECGFCYTGDDDIVVCFSCKGKLKDWDSCNVPLVRHLKVYPMCKHAKSLSKRAPKVTFDSPRIKIDESTTSCIDEEMEDYFKSEFNRLMSFRKCSLSRHVDPYEFAAAGLYYLGDWSETGTSSGTQQMSHHCCISDYKGNKSLTDEERKQAELFFPQLEKREKSMRAIAIDSSKQTDTVNVNESHKYPIHPDYADKSKRLLTLKGCRSTFPIPVESLAEAGFYSAGKKDLVVCFQCGGELLDWERDDNPWDEHALHYPQCQWLLKEKGMKFINSIQKKYGTSEDLKESHSPEKDQNPTSAGRNITLADKTKPIVGKTSLLDEIEKLKERSLCKICLDDDVELLFLPCKHLVVCVECGGRIESCPICRSYADEKVRVFMP